MITRAGWIATALAGGLAAAATMGQEASRADTSYQGLKCAAPTLGTTWTILDRDRAQRPVERYLSSLGKGEGGTGLIASPPFTVAGDTISFSLCGHDGQAGGRGENFIALVDVRRDVKEAPAQTLVKTPAPQSDALQERKWDVSRIKGTQVRIEVHDGNSAGAFAWLGVGHIDASPALRVDFREGIPDRWERPEKTAEIRYELLAGGIPFQRVARVFSLVPKTGAVDIPCGFTARRLFFLGCTVSGGRPLQTYGSIEIHYRDGVPDSFPLLCGFTLDGGLKRLSPSTALHLHASSDPYQHVLAIAPRQEVIDKVRLLAGPDGGPTARITAITCETSDKHEQLAPLPQPTLSPSESEWIADHTLSASHPALESIQEVIRKDHRLP